MQLIYHIYIEYIYVSQQERPISEEFQLAGIFGRLAFEHKSDLRQITSLYS